MFLANQCSEAVLHSILHSPGKVPDTLSACQHSRVGRSSTPQKGVKHGPAGLHDFHKLLQQRQGFSGNKQSLILIFLFTRITIRVIILIKD